MSLLLLSIHIEGRIDTTGIRESEPVSKSPTPGPPTKQSIFDTLYQTELLSVAMSSAPAVLIGLSLYMPSGWAGNKTCVAGVAGTLFFYQKIRRLETTP